MSWLPRFVELDGNQRELSAAIWLGRKMTWRPLTSSQRIIGTATGTSRDDLAMELARIGDRAVDGHDRAGGQDRMHGVVGQASRDRLRGIGQPCR